MGAPAGGHVVDRALAVHGLLAAGRTPAEVQRRLAKSKGYVSVLGYLGHALAGVELEDLARLRSPALTPRAVWPLVTRARTDERAALRQAFGAATTDAARADARRHARARATVRLRAELRAVVQAAAAGLAAPPARRGGRRPRAVHPGAAVTFDPAAWAADPVACAEAHVAALAAAHARVAACAGEAVARAGAEHALAGQIAAAGEGSLRRLGGARWRALAVTARGARTPAEERALAVLGVLTRTLREAHDEVARLDAAPVGAALGITPRDVDPAHPPDPVQDPVHWEDVEADLHD